MKNILITMVLGLCLISTQAFADTNADASSGSLSASQSGSLAYDASTTTNQSGSIGYIDTSTSSVVNEAVDLKDTVPSVFAAGVTAGGSNPCIVSVGAGASGSGFGVNFTRAYNDGECQIRESLRLMVAILPNNSDKGSQMLIRETACQSDIYWQSMERVFIQTKDDRFLCSNPRPDNRPIAIRDRVQEQIITTAIKQPVQQTTYISNSSNGFF